MKMTGQTRVILGTAIALAAVDIAVRLHQPRPVLVNGSSEVVTAREFRLVDKDGNTRIAMSIDDNNEPGIRLYDRSGQVRAQLDTWQQTPSLILNGPDGSRRVYFGMDSQGGGMLDMLNPDGSEMVTVDATDGTPRVTLHDENGSTRASLNVDADGHTNFFSVSENGALQTLGGTIDLNGSPINY